MRSQAKSDRNLCWNCSIQSVIMCKHLKSNIKKLLNKEQVGELGFSTTNAVITLYAQVEIVKWLSSDDKFFKFIF